MNTRTWTGTAGLLVVLTAAWWGGPMAAAESPFTLAAAVPDDVFIFNASRTNPERAFLDAYWSDVFDALKNSGIDTDVMELIGMIGGEETTAEVERMKELAKQLIAGVDWDQLAGKEVAFAERLNALSKIGDNVFMGPPDFVVLFRGTMESTPKNYEGLVAILDAVIAEINRMAGEPVLTVQRAPRLGADVASVNFLGKAPGAATMTLSIFHHEDVIGIAMGDDMLADVLGLRAGQSAKAPMAKNPRFLAAFGKLPLPDDAMTFFDMQRLLASVRTIFDGLMEEVAKPDDVMLHVNRAGEAFELSNQAIKACYAGDLEKCLQLTRQAHEKDPSDSRILYNLACVQALRGDSELALKTLNDAVEAGFYCPKQLTRDSDLDSIRGDRQYQAAFSKACRMAEQFAGADVVRNSIKSGEAHELSMQAWEAYKRQDYKKGLDLVEQAYEKSPDDSRVLYYMACFRALNGHPDEALDFLERAVNGGFYCPRHIANDPDLRTIRADARYEAALAAAARAACQQSETTQGGMVARTLALRVLDVPAILDYTAAVELTDGFSTRTESIAVLAPDAKSKPIYPVIGNRPPMTNFERYLPQETASFTVSNGIDFTALYTFLEDSVRLTGPPGEEILEAWAAMQKSSGMDVKNDIIGNIDGQSISVTLDEGRGWIWMVKVNDEDKARQNVAAGIDLLAGAMTEAAQQNPALTMLAIRKMPLEHETLKGFENVYFSVDPQPFVWGVADGHLIFARNADVVTLCLATAKGEHPNVRSNPRVMEEAIVPDGSFVSVTLTDQRRLGQELAGLIGMISMTGGVMTMMIPDPEAQPIIGKVVGMIGKLAPVLAKIDFYKSTATCTTFDGHAWRTRSVTHYVAPQARAVTKAD